MAPGRTMCTLAAGATGMLADFWLIWAGSFCSWMCWPWGLVLKSSFRNVSPSPS